MKYDDKYLLKSLKEEDHNALKYVYKNYYQLALNVLTKYGADVDDIKDVMQISIMDLVRNIQLDKFKGDSKLETYFLAIAKNKWYTIAKKNQKNRTLEITEQFVLTEEESSEKSTEEEVIVNVFERLKIDCYKLLKLFYYEEMSMKDIAKKMDYSEGFVRVKKNRCMEGLKKQVFENSIIQKKYPNAKREK